MKDFDISQLQARAVQIRIESRLFIDSCKTHIQNSRVLHEEIITLSDETMILKEEALAEKCKSLAILKLTHKLQSLPEGKHHIVSSFDEDTEMAKQMIEEIKQVLIADDSPLQALKSHLLGLSFLPV